MAVAYLLARFARRDYAILRDSKQVRDTSISTIHAQYGVNLRGERDWFGARMIEEKRDARAIQGPRS